MENNLLCLFLLCILFSNKCSTHPVFLVAAKKSGVNEEIIDDSLQGSDLSMFNLEYFQGDIVTNQRRSKVIDEFKMNLWPSGTIIYKLDESLGCPDSRQCEMLMTAMNHYHKHTCVRFQQWTGEESYVRVFLNKRSECWSAVGRVGGEQLLSLGRRCWYLGIVVHELGHAVGLQHEMNRNDRDNFIDINWANILPGFAPAFQKTSFTPTLQNFDYTSIMMYDEFAFSKGKKLQTISAKDKSVIGPVWRKPGLSLSDVRTIDQLYGCSGKTATSLSRPRPDVTCTFDSHTCGFTSTGTNVWQWSHFNSSSDGFVYSKFAASSVAKNDKEKANNGQQGYLVSVNFPGTNSSENPLRMGCILFWHRIEGGKESNLKVRQSFLSSPNQLAVVAQDTFDLWETDSSENNGTWTFQKIPLYVTLPFKLIFESSFNSLHDGLVAVDDFTLSYHPCH